MNRYCRSLSILNSIYALLLFSLPSLGSVKRIEVIDYLKNERIKIGQTSKIRLAGMRGSDFYNIDLSGLDLRNVDFTGCKIGHVNFSKSQLKGAIFKNTDLYHTDFSHTLLHGIDFTGCDLRLASFDHADLTGSVGFGKLDFGSVSAKYANLTGLILSHKDFEKFDFTGANLSQCDLQFSRLRWKPGLTLKDANTKNALLLEIPGKEQKRLLNDGGAIVTHAEFAKALRSGVSYKHINLRSIIFQNLDLTGVNFSHYQLRYCQFIDCDLSDARFNQAKLIGSDFKDSNLQRASFAGAKCDRVNFGKSNLDGADFTDASIHNAKFTESLGETTPSLDQLADESDYEWNEFWYSVERFFATILPFAWAVTTIIYVVFWIAFRKRMETWLNVIGSLTLFAYFIFFASMLGPSLDALLIATMLSLAFIAFEVLVGISLIITHCVKGDILKIIKSSKHSITFFVSNILMLFWLISFAGMLIGSAG